MKQLLILFAGLAGACLPIQSAVNAGLARHATPLWAAAISASISTVTLALLAAGPMRAPFPTAGVLGAAPAWTWVGGLLGCVILLGMMTVAPRLGTATMVASVVAGQMACSLLLDHFGWLGLPLQPLTLGKVAGAAAVCAGVALIRAF